MIPFAGEDLADCSRRKGEPVEARDFAASLLHQQHAGSGVPGIEIEFPKAVIASGCNTRQSSAAEPARRRPCERRVSWW